MEEIRLKSYEHHIIKLLDHPSVEVKTAAIKQLYYYRKGTTVEKIKQLVHAEDDELYTVQLNICCITPTLVMKRSSPVT